MQWSCMIWGFSFTMDHMPSSHVAGLQLKVSTHLTQLKVFRHKRLLDVNLPGSWRRGGSPGRAAARRRPDGPSRRGRGQAVQHLPELLHLSVALFFLLLNVRGREGIKADFVFPVLLNCKARPGSVSFKKKRKTGFLEQQDLFNLMCSLESTSCTSS